jgi:outer membrane protein assembly factor BamB
VRYSVPNFRAAPKQQPNVVQPGSTPQGSPPLIRQWAFDAKGRLSQPPLLSFKSAVATRDDGAVFAVARANAGDEPADLRTSFQTQGEVVAPLAINKGIVYIPCQDSFLYAFNTDNGQLEWRFAGQAPIVAGPLATDFDVFVRVDKKALFRLNRATGNVVWSNKEAVKVLAANLRFVYAVDRVGNMLVLDYERGKTMAAWDARDWVLTIANDLTDRVFMAANDGQILCLHHRDLVRPMVVRTFESELPPPKKG